jgi:hypothetical protein
MSGVKHHGKMPWITTSATVGSVVASVRHCSTTVFQIVVAGVPAAVQGERADAAGMAGGQVDAHGGAERHARDMGLVDPDGIEEGGDLVGLAVGRVGAGRLVALARAGKVDRDAAKVLRVGRQLERPAGVVG